MKAKKHQQKESNKKDILYSFYYCISKQLYEFRVPTDLDILFQIYLVIILGQSVNIQK